MTTAAIQDRLKDLVTAAPLLTGRPVLVEEKGNLVSELETALSTQSLAVTIALASGSAKDGAPRGRDVWNETFEVVIHRGLLDTADVPSTVAVLDQLRLALKGAAADETNRHAGTFSCSRHDLREGGDGTYARVLNVTIENTLANAGA